MYSNPLEAYKTVEKTTISGRETEARVLTQAALKLKDCRDNWSAKDRDEKLDEALKYTQRIWSIFQGELSRKDNPLPRQLKINLLQLSSFIDKRIFETMSYPSPEKLTAVININQNIAAGLRGSPSDL
ncbi:MAG: flagellar biosynthesis regulator FlaF [Deltaproteobacteria bacterium]|nr:flagellar biosynthesis regulator FlaF [Deltaproteobacteria bacterium]